MIGRVLRIKYLCSSASIANNLAFKGVKDNTVYEQIVASVAVNAQNKQKLDALADVLLSLNNLQIQYLICLQNEKALSENRRIIDSSIFSTSEDRKSVIQYLYQKKWIQEVWKDYHILNSLFSASGDMQGVQDQAQVVKEIYQFELTSVDPAQKIKVIKVIRQLLNLGLKQAKDIVDKAPVVMKKGKKQQGQKLKQQLAKNGCVVTLK